MDSSEYTIRTATGVKTFQSSDQVVLPHEHIIIDSRVWWEGDGDGRVFDTPEALKHATSEAIAENPQKVLRENMLLSDWYLSAKELAEAREAGTTLVVDLTVLGSGPDVRSAVKAASAAKMDIVVSVGRYLHDAVPSAEHSVDIPELIDRWMLQITEGIDGYLPGIIGEIGTSEDLYDDEIVSLRAAGSVQEMTGLPMNIHVHPYAHRARTALEIAAAAGADPRRVAISHLDCEIDLNELRDLLAQGAYVEFDNFGTSRSRKVEGRGYPDDSERLDAIDALIQDGYVQQILLSHDINHRNSLHSNGGWGYAHIARTVRRRIQERFGEDVARQLTNENPLRLLNTDRAQETPA